MGKYFRDYAEFLAGHFPGKIQKLTVDAGFSCPNRDGTIGRGGCVYCNNSSFSPALGSGEIAAQLERGKAFFKRKYSDMRYLAYFQSYTNTHGPLEQLLRLYQEALSVPEVEGLIIGTRPDCISAELLKALGTLGKPVFMEYGAESSHNATLATINRCHTWQQTVDAVNLTHAAGLPVGLHFIMGLPGETEDMMLDTVERAAALPISTIKFHQLQVIRGTTLARELEQNKWAAFRGQPIKIFDVEEYIGLCVSIVERIRRVNPALAIERFTSQAPSAMLLAPKWGLKNYQFAHLLEKALSKNFG